MDTEFVLIAKINGAQRQLDEAIRMFFEQRNTIAIHTLASAAENIVFDIAADKKTFRIIDLIRPEFKQQFLKLTRGTQNFLKHADRDPNQQLQYCEGQTHFKLWEAVQTYKHLGQELTPEQRVYIAWFVLKYPDVVDLSLFPAEIQKAWLERTVSPSDWQLFRDQLAETKD